jgi:DNA-directed RNA polymerase subunit E'/Rpb7
MTLYRPVFMDRRVQVTPSELGDAAADIDAFLLKKIRKGLEGACCTHGYVRKGSTQMLARSMGQAEHCRFTGDFMYFCKIRILCMLPEVGQVVDAQVLKANKLGAYALVVDQGNVTEAMRILVPRDLHIGNAEFDDLMPDQIVRVRILRSRFQGNDAFIQAVGTYEGPSSIEAKGAAKFAQQIPPTEKLLAAATAVASEPAAAAPAAAAPAAAAPALVVEEYDESKEADESESKEADESESKEADAEE